MILFFPNRRDLKIFLPNFSDFVPNFSEFYHLFCFSLKLVVWLQFYLTLVQIYPNIRQPTLIYICLCLSVNSSLKIR